MNRNKIDEKETGEKQQKRNKRWEHTRSHARANGADRSTGRRTDRQTDRQTTQTETDTHIQTHETSEKNTKYQTCLRRRTPPPSLPHPTVAMTVASTGCHATPCTLSLWWVSVAEHRCVVMSHTYAIDGAGRRGGSVRARWPNTIYTYRLIVQEIMHIGDLSHLR